MWSSDEEYIIKIKKFFSNLRKKITRTQSCGFEKDKTLLEINFSKSENNVYNKFN